MQNNYSNKKRKQNTYKRKTYRKKKYRGPRATNYMLKKLIKNKELKIVDFKDTQTITHFSAGMRNWLLNGTIPGTSFYNRVGNKFLMKSVHIRASIYGNSLIPETSADLIRIMLVYDKTPNRAYPTTPSLLQGTNKTGVQLTDSWAFINPGNRNRFKVIRDWCKMTPEVTTGTENKVGIAPWMSGGGTSKGTLYTIDEYIKLKDLVTVCTKVLGNVDPSTEGTITEIVTGALYFIALKSENAQDDSWYIDFNTRLVFEDS